MHVENLDVLIDSFISYKRSLGYIYDTQERYLKNYQKYVETLFPGIVLPDKESVDSFLDTMQGCPGGLHNAMAPLREFARHLICIGYKDAYLIPSKQMPKLHPEPPYFFSEEEILAFFAACDEYFEKHPGTPGRRFVLPAEFRLLYCCGLRPKEARTLKTSDVHLSERYIDVCQSKGPKSRRIFISEELAKYLSQYDSTISGMFPDRVYFFSKSNDKAYSNRFLYYGFTLVWKTAFPKWEGKLPRIYDFRHHFAWATINRWAREGTDVNAMLPYLMRYMGHNCLKHTLYYFRFVPDFYPDYRAIAGKLDDRIPEVSDD